MYLLKVLCGSSAAKVLCGSKATKIFCGDVADVCGHCPDQKKCGQCVWPINVTNVCDPTVCGR